MRKPSSRVVTRCEVQSVPCAHALHTAVHQLLICRCAEPAELFQHDGPLSEVDPQIAEIIKQEKGRQVHGLELIASENFTSRAVRSRPLPPCRRMLPDSMNAVLSMCFDSTHGINSLPVDDQPELWQQT